jgi:DNA-directed RNA polymerase specialized sigma subunit
VHVTAHVTRDGKWWMVDIPGFGLTQARRVSEIATMARSLVAVVRDIAEDDVEVELRYSPLDDVDVSARLEAIAETRRLAEDYDRQVREQTQALARALAAHHVPQRDIGAVLGVSGQRANQLLSA